MKTKIIKQIKLAGLIGKTIFFVSPQGNDQWSGKLPVPNRDRTDGPFATLTMARDAIRRVKKACGKLPGPITVRLRGGKYYIPEAIVFTPDDSGSRECPITYEAYPGETPILSGGRKITGWQPYKGEILSTALPEVKRGRWHFRSLFADGKRQIRARYPNVDPKNPYRSGFLYAGKASDESKYRRLPVHCISRAGDELEYKIKIPADGHYDLWMLYSGDNKSCGFQDMSGRTSIRLDDQAPIPLPNLPDTDDCLKFKWARCIRLSVSRGVHTLTWRNNQGGLIFIDAFALCSDAGWKPGAEPWPKSSGKGHLLLMRARDFSKAQARELMMLPFFKDSYGKTRFPYRAGDVKPVWARASDAEIHIYPSKGCIAYMQITRLKRVDEQSHTVQIGGKECVTALTTGDRFFVENVFEELDSPEEWYLNRKTGVLYFWPGPKRAPASDIIAPRLNRLFHFTGMDNNPVRFIRLSGLAMCETDYSPDGCIGWGMGNNGVVYLQSADDCAVQNCRFSNIGDYAVYLFGGRRNAIIGNDAAYGGEGGITLFNSAENTIADNHIHHCGQVHKHIGGVVLHGPGSRGNLISHNLVHDMSRYGISLKNPGQHNVIEYNEVFNTNLETYDTGGIEVTQHDREFRSHSVIRYNLVHDNVGYSSDMGIEVCCAWGIYLDSFAGGYTISHNLTYRNSWGGIMIQGGKDNKVFNNIFIGGGHDQMTVANYAENSTGLEFARNIFYCLGHGIFDIALGRKVLRSDRNLYYHGDHAMRNSFRWGSAMRGNRLSLDLAAWQKAGFDKNSLVADPLFVNPAKDNYCLKPDSPAFHLGFEPIAIEKTGLIRKRCSCRSRPALPGFKTCEWRCEACRARRIGAVPCQHLQTIF